MMEYFPIALGVIATILFVVTMCDPNRWRWHGIYATAAFAIVWIIVVGEYKGAWG